MITSKTFLFTSLSNMSSEYTFRFTPFQGAIYFEHELNLTAYDNWGKWIVVLHDADIQLPYSKQIFVSGTIHKIGGSEANRKAFGTLHIQAKEVKADSITVKYWVDVYSSFWFGYGFTWEGILKCVTEGPTFSEVIETFDDLNYQSSGLANIFDFETFVYIQATDGITTGGTRTCTIKTDSGESISVTLNSLPAVIGGDAKYYRGSFFLTSGTTSQSERHLHFNSHERAILKCDINGDDVFAITEIWAAEHSPPPPPRTYIKVYANSLYSIEKYEFDAEETAYVIVTDGRISGYKRHLIIRADSGDSITVPLVEDIATRYKCSFKITAGATDQTNYLIHLEAGERATLLCRFNQDTEPLTIFIYRTGVPVETVKTYSDSGYGTEEDTFDLETNVFVEATNSSETGGTKILSVVGESGSRINVTLTEGPATCYRGYFKITLASTRDDDNEIHLNPNDKATLYCDVDGDGMVASTEIWADTKPDDPNSSDATHYQIQVNTQQDMLGTMMWDSQKCSFTVVVVAGTRCPDIDYAGSQLDLSGKITYWWRIKFWINQGAEETPWSTEEAYFRGMGIAPPPPPDPLPDADIRKPRGKVEVEIGDAWNNLEDVRAIQISNNKNPLDKIETAQGTVYLSNIAEKFYPDKESSQYKDQLFGRRIRMSLGFLDWLGSGMPVYVQKMMGIVKSIETNRKEKTAEIVALEFIDFYRTKEIKITPVYRDLSLSELYYELVRHCFPSWLNQHESTNWDYWVDLLGFRRTNVYLGTGEPGGSESIPLKDCLRTPCQWIYDIIADSEAIYNDDEQRLFRGIDYEITRENTDKGIISWVRFLKEPYPTDDNHFYAAVTVDARVEIVQYEDTTLIEELEKIILVADCRLFTDAQGRLICKSNELEETVAKDIAYNTNLMDITTRKDIDSIINHVVVESKPYQSGTGVDLGTIQISFMSRASAEAGKERTFYFDEFVENFRFDLNWNLECMALGGLVICFGSGSKLDFILPLRRNDDTLGILLRVAGGWYCDLNPNYADLHVEFIEGDAHSLTIKAYLVVLHPRAWDNSINFTVSLTCRGEGIGQPETYRGEAIDEVTYQDRYIRRRKKTFVLEYLEPGNTAARQAAFALLASLRNIQVYYNCSIRGLPYLNLMDTVALTAPKLDIFAKEMQVIKLIDNMQIANYLGEVELLERQMPTGIPFYWYPAEHDFIINTPEQLIQEVTFGFNAEIESYKFSHSYEVFASTGGLPHGDQRWIRDCYGSGEDENFDLPYVVDITVWYHKPDGSEAYLDFGTLTINLFSETPTSITVRYILDIPYVPRWQWPIDWLGTLSLYVEFKRQGEIAEPGDAPSDEPHYPPDEPFAPPDDQPDDGWEYEPEFVVVGETSDRFIWALQEFSGSLYAGTYKMHLPRIYSYLPWKAITTFSGGESILGLQEFNGSLYATSEDMGYAGKVYRRTSDTVWTAVHTETTWYPKPIIVFNGYLYVAWANASLDIKILRSSDGTTWTQVATWSNKNMTNFVIFRNELYILGGFQPSNESWVAKTSNGTTWNNVDILCYHTYPFPWHSGTAFQDNLFIGQDGGKSIYKYTGEKKIKVFQALESIYGTHSCYVFDDRVYFFFGQRWKTTSGDSFLYCSGTGNSGDWELLQKFGNTQNARGITESNNKLYVAADKKLYELRN